MDINNSQYLFSLSYSPTCPSQDRTCNPELSSFCISQQCLPPGTWFTCRSVPSGQRTYLLNISKYLQSIPDLPNPHSESWISYSVCYSFVCRQTLTVLRDNERSLAGAKAWADFGILSRWGWWHVQEGSRGAVRGLKPGNASSTASRPWPPCQKCKEVCLDCSVDLFYWL